MSIRQDIPIFGMEIDASMLEELFSALGAHLKDRGVEIAIVVVGGASLASNRLVDRTTKDVDVIARADLTTEPVALSPASPLPEEFHEATAIVARDFSLPKDWLNTVIESQWKAGLPSNILHNIRWETYSTLTIGFVSREALIPLKLFASLDQGPNSKHWRDLIALNPTSTEVDEAAEWVRRQDAGIEFSQFVEEAVERLRQDLEERLSDDD